MNFEKLLTELAPEVTALVTYRGFNACHYTGIPPEQAAESKVEIASLLGIDTNKVIIPTQTHSCRVAIAGEDLNATDAVVTDKSGIALCINTADCLPLIMVDVTAGVIGAAHCGWRGTVGRIAQSTISAMVGLGADPKRIIAAMGPCICASCFEVGEEVASLFPPETVIRSQGRKPHVDLATAVTKQLTESGVIAGHIARPIACSMEERRYYSVRREGRDLRERTLTLIMIK